ncbi:hypothetical protein ACFQPA_03050 [Halomarina halobia]|uniref:DUF2238 domain-containing protein n=1 Tax=Halomarina halobia TaxID=3033386 RepID=A0ABD6A5W0_9EURY|nr:hypothetical protein [Halomarina sp. PSR21]
MRVREYLGIDDRRQRQLVWAMEVCLVGMFFIGLDRGNTGIIVNTAVALGVTRLPSLLERDFSIPMDPGLTLWITTAVFLHALGTVGLPKMNSPFYQSVWWWDHLTHTLSATVVAAVGYSGARALELHSDSNRFPGPFMFVYILLFVIAFGVLWEVIEFLIGEVAALVGATSVLTQYGVEDTMLDLVFNTIGAVIVAVWGTAHLTDVAHALSTRLALRRAD